MTDWELWACAHQVLSQHRGRAPEFIAERIGAMVLTDNRDGLRVWKEIARRAADLMMPAGRVN